LILEPAKKRTAGGRVEWSGQNGSRSGHDFADTAAARLTELRSSVLADRIEADLALGEGASLVGELRALLSADPLAERPRALLMRALYAAGRQAEALEVYHQARELLGERLGVDPSAQLEQVYLRILRGEEGVPAVATGAARTSDKDLDAERAVVPAAGTTSPLVAPSPLTSFVGRDTEVSQVLKNLGSARLVTLTGPGGVGKTRLATEVSGRLPGSARRTAGRQVRAAHPGQPDRIAAAPDAAGRGRLELGPARARRAGPGPQARRVPGRRHTGHGRTGLRRRAAAVRAGTPRAVWPSR
jgi:hypothetical protein